MLKNYLNFQKNTKTAYLSKLDEFSEKLFNSKQFLVKLHEFYKKKFVKTTEISRENCRALVVSINNLMKLINKCSYENNFLA